jgi:hypothetical protein
MSVPQVVHCFVLVRIVVLVLVVVLESGRAE